MNRFSFVIAVISLNVVSVQAQSVSLSGTVRKPGSTSGIGGVSITLVRLPHLSATTSADGTFILAGSSRVLSQEHSVQYIPFTLNNTVLAFHGGFHHRNAVVELFSIDGTRIQSVRIPKSPENQRLVLPGCNSGIRIFRVTFAGHVYTCKAVSLTSGMMSINNGEIATGIKNSAAAKKLTPGGVDTIIVAKSGYMTKKLVIDSYNQTDMVLVIDSAFGNPDGHYPIPPEAEPEDVSSPDHVIGTGTPESCTPEAFIEAVARGGVIVFNTGNQPAVITVDTPAKVFNDAASDIVIDGGGLITLSGGGSSRILYMNTCDSVQHWTTSHCQNQDNPRLTVQNLTFAEGNSKNETEYDGGGAIWVRGGRFKIVNCRFFNNVCADSGPDVGGAAVRVFSQFENSPVYVVNTTFGGAEGMGNVGSNGGGISSIGVLWTIINCLFSHNRAIGNGGNPAQSGTPGGGSGGAIYNDGNTMTLSILGTLIEKNEVNAYGSAIFFVTNDLSGDIRIEDSTIRDNKGGSWYVLPGISMHDDTKRSVTNSVIE